MFINDAMVMQINCLPSLHQEGRPERDLFCLIVYKALITVSMQSQFCSHFHRYPEDF